MDVQTNRPANANTRWSGWNHNEYRRTAYPPPPHSQFWMERHYPRTDNTESTSSIHEREPWRMYSQTNRCLGDVPSMKRVLCWLRRHLLYWAENLEVYTIFWTENLEVYHFLNWKPGSIHYFLNWKPGSVYLSKWSRWSWCPFIFVSGLIRLS